MLRAFLAALCILWITAACAGPFAPLFGKSRGAGDKGTGARETGNIVLRDTLNMPISMNMIPGGRPALCYVCDPSEVTCREGAVYFDSQAGKIRRRNIQPVCIFVASLEVAGSETAKMGLTVPVLVDVSRAIPDRLIGQDIMPALILLDGSGNVSRVIVGGGESLDTNISTALEAAGSKRWASIWIVAPLVALGVILIAAL